MSGGDKADRRISIVGDLSAALAAHAVHIAQTARGLVLSDRVEIALLCTARLVLSRPGERESAMSQIRILGYDDRPYRVSLTNVDVHMMGTPFRTVDDPEWRVHDDAGNFLYQSEWLGYIGADGQRWGAKAHCAYHDGTEPYGVPSGVHTWFEFHRPDGSTLEDEQQTTALSFMNGDHVAKRVNVLTMTPVFPREPIFAEC